MNNFYDALISYGRADSKNFAEKLCDRLTSLGLKLWFDQNDIPPSVDYQKKIDSGIEKAHNFIFIIAPHSAKSIYCRKEIDLALKYNKRIIPLLHVKADRAEMHQEIRKFNWIYFQEEIDDFDKSFHDLMSSIRHQSNYVEQHTQFLVKALEWERHQKQSNYLLIRKERLQAESWLKTPFKNEQPPCEPTDLHCEFICESSKNAKNLMAQVFISYANQNAALAEKIAKSLMRANLTIWREQSDLKTGIGLEDLIKQGIEESDNIVFLLSAHSLISPHCLQQRNYAAALNKRIIFILIENLEKSQIPREISSFQFLDFTGYNDQSQYAIKSDELVKELYQDAAYFEQHKILLVKALKWQSQNSNPSILLRGYNLGHFEAWLKIAQQRTEHPSLPLHEEFIRESLQHPGESSLEVFISYSRSDSEFARKLNDTLQELGKTTWFDQESIASASDFQQEIYRGIELSDNFLFIISEQSVASPYCADEVEYAQKLNKRFVTVIYEDHAPSDLHTALAKVQWINFSDRGGDFYANFSELVRTLETDREHVQSHTKWSLKAMEWDEKKRNDSFLLRGSNLQEAQEWLQEWIEKGAGKKPKPTSLQKDYIHQSQEAEKARQIADLNHQKAKSRLQRIALGSVSVAFLVACLGVIGVLESRKVAIGEVEALANSSQALLTPNDNLKALVKAIKAKQKLLKLGKVDANTQKRVESTLQQAISEVKEYNRLENNDMVFAVAISPDGEKIASASSDNNVKLWNADGSLIKSLEGHNKWVVRVAWSPDGKTLASASDDKTVKLWKADGTLLKTLTGHSDGVRGVAWSPDGKTLASASGDKTVKLWKADGTLLKTLTGHSEGVWGVAWSPDGKTLASASGDKTVKLWKADGTLLKTLTGHSEGVWGVAWSPDGKTLASASGDKTVKLWKADGALLKTLTGHSEGVLGVAWSTDGKTLASASGDRTVKLWKVENSFLTVFNRLSSEVNDPAWSPDGKTLASGSEDSTVKLWNADGKLLKTLVGHKEWVNAVAWNPDGKTLASASDDKTVKLWNADGKLLKTLVGHKDDVYKVVWSPDGKTLASASGDKTVKLWNADGKLLKTLVGHKEWVNAVAWNPDGKTLASASDDKMVKLWNADGKLLKTLAGHKEGVYKVAWSPDGKILASASGDKTVKLWNADGKEIKTLTGYKKWIYEVAWSPDGKILASASDDKTVKLWNADGTELLTLFGYDSGVQTVAWSSDGKTLRSLVDNKVVLTDLDRILNLDTLAYGCDWIRDYLKHNTEVESSDRTICDGVGAK